MSALPDAPAALPPLAYKPERAAQRLGVCRGTLYKVLSLNDEDRGGLPHLKSVKAGRRRLITEAALCSWLAALERQAA